MNNLLKKLFIITLFLNSAILGSNSLTPIIIERISQFIEWPNVKDEFIIGIYQNENLKDEMINTYQDKTIQKRPIQVFNIKNKYDLNLQKVDLLYFTKELSVEVEQVLNKVKERPVLTITEFPNDVFNGMDLGLYYENQRIKFIINQEGLEKKELSASYKLLNLAKIVKVGE